MGFCLRRAFTQSVFVTAVPNRTLIAGLLGLRSRPQDRLRTTQTPPHPGPLPSDGRGRIAAGLIANPAVSSVARFAHCFHDLVLAGLLQRVLAGCFFLLPFGVLAHATNVTAAPRPLAAYGNLPLYFETNHGQAESGVRFLARGQGYSFLLSPSE